MELGILIDQYINYRKSLGEKFKTNEVYLKAFCKAIDSSMDICNVNEEIVDIYLYHNAETITSKYPTQLSRYIQINAAIYSTRG